VETAQALDELKASGAIGIALRWSPGGAAAGRRDPRRRPPWCAPTPVRPGVGPSGSAEQ